MTATNPSRRIFVRIPPAEHRRVKREAKREAISMAEYTRRALLWYLANRAHTPVRPPTYKPTPSELATIRKGEAAIARGEQRFVIGRIQHGVDRERNRRKPATKASRKISRSDQNGSQTPFVQ